MANDFKRGIRVYLETSDYGVGMDKMVAKTKELEKQYQNLTEETKKLTSAGTTSGKEWDKNQKALSRVELQIQKNKTTEAQYQAKLEQTKKVLNNLSGVSYNELLKVKTQINKELREEAQGTARYNTLLEQQHRVSKQLSIAQKDMTTQIGCQGSAWGRAADGVNKYMALIGTAMAAITGVTFAIKKFMDLRDAKEESQANLQALTGLDKESIGWLTEQSEQLSTQMTKDGVRIRQSSQEILDAMTVVGSQRPELLKNKEALLSVTRDAITMSIASKDSLEASTAALTNVLNQFNLEGTESNRVINAMAAGSKVGAATIPYLSEAVEKSGTTFALMGVKLETAIGVIEGVAPKFKRAEMAGNSLDKVLLKMKESGIGYQSGVFNMNDALLELKSRFEKGESSAKIFGIEHAKMAEVLVQAIPDIQRFTDGVTGSNTALEQANINSETRKAKMAQAVNSLNEAGQALVKNLNPAMIAATNISSSFIKVLVKYPEITYALIAAIGILTLSYIADTAAKVKNYAVSKAQLILNGALRIANLAGAAAQALFTGNTMRARIAMSMLNKEMIVNPYIAIAAAVVALGVGIYKLATRTTEAQKAIKEFNKEALEQQRELNNVFEAYKKANPGTEEKIRLLKIIKEKYGDYIQNLIDEKGNITDIEKAQLQANTALRQSIALKIQNASIDEVASEEIEKQSKTLSDIHSYVKEKKGADIANIITSEIGRIYSENSGDLKKAYSEAWKLLSKYNLSPVLKKGMFSGSLSSDLLDLSISFDKVNTKTTQIKEVFKGLIGDAGQLAGALDGGAPNPDGSPGASTLTEDEKKAIEADKKRRADEAKKTAEAQAKARKQLLEDSKLKIEIETAAYTQRLKDAGLYEMEYSKMTEDQLNIRTELEEKYYTNLEKITTEAENKRFEKEKSDLGLTGDPTKLKGEKLQAYELLVKQHEINLEQITKDGETKRQTFAESIDKAILASLQKAGDAQIKTIDAVEKAKLQKAKTDYSNAKFSKEQYEAEVDTITENALNDRLAAQQDFNELLAGLEMAATPEYIAALQASQKAIADTQEKIDDAKIKKHESAEKEKAKIASKYSKDTILGEYELEMAALEKRHVDEMMSEEEFQREKLKLKLNAAQKYTQQVGEIVNAGSNFVQALQTAETASVQADYAQRLAGLNESDANYAEQKEQLQYEQAVAELDVQKKYADAQFGIQVAQIGVATATGIMNAWASSMTLGPIAGPIAAGLMTALLLGTGLAQVSAASSERDKIKSSSIESPSSSSGNSSTPSTGARVVNQAASGRWDVVGAEDGKVYRNVPYTGVARTGIINSPTLVGEEPEIVIDNPTTRNIIMNAPWLLGEIKKHRVPQRASGKYDAVDGAAVGGNSAAAQAQNNEVLMANISVMAKVAALLQYLKDNGVHAWVLLSDLEKKQALRDMSIKKGSLK